MRKAPTFITEEEATWADVHVLLNKALFWVCFPSLKLRHRPMGVSLGD